MIKGVFFRSFHGRKIVRIEMDGEKFTVRLNDGEVLTDLNLNELNHVVASATGR